MARSTTGAIVAFGAIAPMALLVAPVLTGQLMQQYGLGPAEAGHFLLFELGGLSLASLPALWWTGRYRADRVAFVAGAGFVLANIASALITALPLLLGIRLLSALAGGTLMVLSMREAARAPRSDRMFGLWVLGQLVLGALALAVLPRLFALFGLRAFYCLAAALMVLALPLANRFSDGMESKAAQSAGQAPHWRIVGAAVGVLACFYMAISGCWSFLTVIGQQAGIAAIAAGDVVATASLFGIAGALAAWALGGRLDRRLLLAAGFAILVAAVLLLAGFPKAGFIASAFLFKFAWTFALPPVLAAIGSHDAAGRIMSWSNLVIGVGNVAGPVLAGHLLAQHGATAMLLAEAVIIALSFGLALILVRRTTGHDALVPKSAFRNA